MLVAIPFGIAIGLIVGAVGGGGAILALPVLVYVLGEGVSRASTASLVVVALAAGVGAGALALRGQVCWRLALTFSAPAAAGAVAGSIGGGAVGAEALILAFVPVMVVAAGATWHRAGAVTDDEDADCPSPRPERIVVSGAGVGALTGFFGVGGGFLIVPALTLWLGVTFRRAVATSLVIITLTGLAALASHLAAGAELDVPLTASFAMSTAVGALLGTSLGARLPQSTLSRAFGAIVACVAIFLAIDTLFLGGPPGR